MTRRQLVPSLLALLLACAAPSSADVFSDTSAQPDFRLKAATQGEFSDVRPAPEDETEEDIAFVESYHPSTGAVLGALAINIVYVPVRFAFTVLGAFAGGLEGIFSVGDKEATDKIYGLTDGSQVITPAMLEGRERWTFSRYGW